MFRDPCGIPDTRNEYFYITGNTTGSIGDLLNQVAKFGPNGFIESLPNLKTGRRDHACAGYYNAQDHFVLLVAGGQTISGGESTGIILLPPRPSSQYPVAKSDFCFSVIWAMK